MKYNKFANPQGLAANETSVDACRVQVMSGAKAWEDAYDLGRTHVLVALNSAGNIARGMQKMMGFNDCHIKLRMLVRSVSSVAAWKMGRLLTTSRIDTMNGSEPWPVPAKCQTPILRETISCCTLWLVLSPNGCTDHFGAWRDHTIRTSSRQRCHQHHRKHCYCNSNLQSLEVSFKVNLGCGSKWPRRIEHRTQQHTPASTGSLAGCVDYNRSECRHSIHPAQHKTIFHGGGPDVFIR